MNRFCIAIHKSLRAPSQPIYVKTIARIPTVLIIEIDGQASKCDTSVAMYLSIDYPLFVVFSKKDLCHFCPLELTKRCIRDSASRRTVQCIRCAYRC
jgi:hypothetical protein